MSIIANSCRDRKATDILNNLPKGLTRLPGHSYDTKPFLSFHDDDAIDYQIPVSYRLGETPKTWVSSTSKSTGFVSFLYVFTKLIIERHRMFTGDANIPGIKVVTTLKGGDKQKAVESVERILRLAEGKVVCAGHEVNRGDKVNVLL